MGRVCSTDHYLLCQAKYASVYMQYKPDFMTPIKTRESPELGKYEEQEVHLNYVQRTLHFVDVNNVFN